MSVNLKIPNSIIYLIHSNRWSEIYSIQTVKRKIQTKSIIKSTIPIIDRLIILAIKRKFQPKSIINSAIPIVDQLIIQAVKRKFQNKIIHFYSGSNNCLKNRQSFSQIASHSISFLTTILQFFLHHYLIIFSLFKPFSCL